MSSGLEIFLPRHPKPGQENGHMGVHRNVEELARMFRAGTTHGQMLAWSTSLKAWVVVTPITIDPTTGAITFIGSVVGDDFLRSRITSDSQFRFVLNADGKMEWGSGAAAPNVNLYRGGDNLLKTDDAFEIAAAGLDALRLTDTSVDTGLTIGGDTNLYRDAANILKTDDQFAAAGGILDHPRCLFQSGDSVSADNTASETELVAITIPANTLGANGMVKGQVYGKYINDTGSSKNLTWRIKFGGTTFWNSGAIPITTSVQPSPWGIEFILGNRNATNAQHLNGFVSMGNRNAPWTTGLGGTGGEIMNSQRFSSADTDPAIDTTADRDLVLTAQHSAAGVILVVERKYASLVLYKMG